MGGGQSSRQMDVEADGKRTVGSGRQLGVGTRLRATQVFGSVTAPIFDCLQLSLDKNVFRPFSQPQFLMTLRQLAAQFSWSLTHFSFKKGPHFRAFGRRFSSRILEHLSDRFLAFFTSLSWTARRVSFVGRSSGSREIC